MSNLNDSIPIDPEHSSARPWTNLTTPQDVELWVDNHNRDLQKIVSNKNATGYGVCFHLAEGGDIFMHTGEDAILLDVTPDAEWVVPAITAATGIDKPRSQLWMLPDDKLIQLVLGLSSLIGSYSLVVDHRYKGRKY